MSQDEFVIHRKSSRILATLGFFSFVFVLLTFGFLGAVYIYRDRLILEYVRDLGPEALGFEALAVDSILTRPIGRLSLEVRGVVFKSGPTAPVVRADRILISTPKNLFTLYQLVFSRQTLPLKVQLNGFQVQLSPDSPTGAASNKTELAIKAPAKAIKLPFPIDLETEFRDAQIQIGPTAKPFTIRNLTGIARSSVRQSQNAQLLIKSTGQLSMGVGLGAKNFLPIRTDWALDAKPQAGDSSAFSIQVTSLTVSTLGMNLKSSGRLQWPERSFSINMSGATTDLGMLPLEPAESEALGISGRLQGAADLDVLLSGTLGGIVTCRGLLRLRQGVFPLNIGGTSGTAQATNAAPVSTTSPIAVRGPVEIDIDAPFDIDFNMADNSVKKLKLQTAKFDVDLTAADVRIGDALRKPAALMMALQTEMNANRDTIDVGRAEFRLANFLVRALGRISTDPRRLSNLEIVATLPSLTGWPRLLPFLGQVSKQDASTSERFEAAKGSFAIKARAELPLSEPSRLLSASKVAVEVFEVAGIELPINTPEATGNLRGNFSAIGSVELSDVATAPVRWSLKRTKGFFDLTDLAIQWKDIFSKKRTQAGRVEFAIQGIEGSSTETRTQQVKVERLDLILSDSTISVTGDFRDLNTTIPSYSANTKIVSRVALSQVYETLPSLRGLRSQVPTGTLTTNLNLKGTLRLTPNANPLEQSPLTAQGTVGLIAPRAIMLAEKTDAVPKSSTRATAPTGQKTSSFLDWPLIKLSNIKSQIQFGTVSFPTGEAKKFGANSIFQSGRLSGSATVGSLFGGMVLIDSFSAGIATMSLAAQGSYRDIDLSMLGEAVDPKWKSAVGGRSTGRFKLVKTPGASLIDSVSIDGAMIVKNGFFSTASIDKLVNNKLAEHPQLTKLLGVKSKVQTGGARVDMSTTYSLAKSVLTLRKLIMKSPEKNEVTLDGWIKPDFSVDLKGKALLANTNIGGSFREANSDSLGRLVVPIHLTGRLTEPTVSIAEDIIAEMIGKTIRLETGKAKSKATKIIDGKKNEVIDAVKEELKKRGLGF